VSMTKGEIRRVCRRFLDEAAAETWTDATLDEFINVAYEIRRAQIISLHRLDFVKTYDFTFPANADFVTYDQIAAAVGNAEFDVQEWVFVEDVQDASDPVEVAYCPWIRRNEVLPSSGTRVAASRRDVGFYWSYKAREFWIIRRPNQDLNLRLNVITPFKPFPVAPNGDLQRPEFTYFNRLIAIDAAILAREAVGDALMNLGALQSSLSDAMIRSYEERNSSEPDYIQATDSDFTGGRGAV